MNQYVVMPNEKKIPTIAEPGHVTDNVSVLLVQSVTIPLMSSQIARSQVNETDDWVGHTAHLFILNI